VAIDTDEYAKRFQESVAEAGRLMETGDWQRAENILTEALRSITDAGLLIQPEHEWLLFQSLWAVCVFHRGGFREAAVILERASQARRSAGLLDWHYFRLRRYLALAKRGLCDFSGCPNILADALVIARSSNMRDACNEITKDLHMTEAIRADAVHEGALMPIGMALTGANGLEVLADERVFLRECESLRYKCHVSDCAWCVEDPYRLGVDLRFTIDNDDCISSWPNSDRYPGSRTPVLFGLLLPKSARVNHGDFVPEVNDPDPGWREKFFFCKINSQRCFTPCPTLPLAFIRFHLLIV
jgi:hypothetical protein